MFVDMDTGGEVRDAAANSVLLLRTRNSLPITHNHPTPPQGVILVHEFVAAQPQLQAWGLKPFADPEAEFNRLDATNNTTADGEVDWDEFLAWAVEHKLDRDDDDSDDESLLQAADVKKRPSVQKASELQK